MFKIITRKKNQSIGWTIAAAVLCAGRLAAMTLVENGEARAVIVAPADRAPLQMNGVDAVEELVEQETVQAPSLKIRGIGGWTSSGTGWCIRQRMGRDIDRATGRHGLPGNPPRGTGSQVCLSGHHAPGALEAVVGALRASLERDPRQRQFSMGPRDGGGYCQCAGCRELDGDSWDPLRSAPSVTDRYIWFFNRVLEELEPEYPDLQIAWYVYAAHFFPPRHVVPNPRIIHTFAPIDIDRNRGMDNPMSPDRLEIFLDMIAARNRHDYNAAHEQMEAYWTLTDALADHVLEGEDFAWPAMRARLALVSFMERSDRHAHFGRDNYFKRFWEPAVVAGHHRTVAAGDLVKGLNDEWDFLIDPAEIGEIGGWHRAGPLGGNWQPLRTTSKSWSDQGLHYYKGVAWYRQAVTVPDEFEGRPIYLWFGGVDRIAQVWINGRYVGYSTESKEGLPGAPGTFRPFDMPATTAIRHGQQNWVTVKIESRTHLAELGTGGIIAPVMFWSPHDPEWRP